MFELSGKTALVTGAGSGIGAAIAQLFAQAGAFVGVIDKDTEAAQATTELIQEEGFKASSHGLDVTEDGACQSMVGDFQDHHGKVDVFRVVD